MLEVSTIGPDIAKNIFHAHGADASGRPLFSRTKLLEFFANQPRFLVALEACGGAHHWARELTLLGHGVGDMDPVRELPYGPAASGAASEAGQMAASDYGRTFKKPLASYGASTDGKRTGRFWAATRQSCHSAQQRTSAIRR